MNNQARQKPPAQLRTVDVATPMELVRNLNSIFAELTERIGTLEKLNGLELLPAIDLKTGAIVAPGTAPFPIRIGLPSFTPEGLFLASVKNMTNGYAPGSLGTANDVKWEVLGGGNALLIHFVSGLLANTTYQVRLAALRG